MQVSVEKTSELGIKMTVSVPAAVVQQKMAARLQSLASKVKIDGFRPGKVPQQVVKKMYGAQIRTEVAEELLKSTYPEALKQQDIMPVDYPVIEFLNDAEGLTYTAAFEVSPNVSLDALDTLEVTRPIASVQETDVDIMIEKLKFMRQTWQLVDRAAKSGDRVSISFSATLDDGSFSTGRIDKNDSGADFSVVIGTQQMIAGFEENLLDLKTGDNKTFPLNFPDDYPNANLAGKPAQFTVDVIKVEETSALPEIDDEFVKAYGLEGGTVESFRDDVKVTMERELEQALKDQFKAAVLSSLYTTVQLPLPKALIDEEINNLAKPYLENAKKQKISMEELNLPREIFEDTAKTRVALSLILRKIIEQQNIQLDETKVRTVVNNMAQSFERPEEVVEYYYADTKRMNDIHQMVLEEQTVEWLAAHATIVDQSLSFSEIMDKQQR
ncbi:trigger factor [Crenothrix polyspora]|uniref:Trigger factor n=1 Tax=Crenothrix polyspora TaxID=360316 RepID=A0A1R4H0S6_9GAMM|nr:trigger factor [Crenothrix polyspora]SJM89843.1 Trigger factor [Crenothrix polyspora]